MTGQSHMRGVRRDAAVALLTAVLGIWLPPTATDAQAQAGGADNSSIVRIASTHELPLTRNLTMGVGRAVIYEFPVDAQDVIISAPDLLDASVLTPRRVMLFAKKSGASNVFILGRDGRRIAIFDVAVGRDLGDLVKLLKSVLPGSRIQVRAAGNSLILTGTVSTPADAARAGEIASQYLAANGVGLGERAAAVPAVAGGAGASAAAAPGATANGGSIINMLTTGMKEQVLLKVVVAELQRDAMRRIGVNLPEAILKAGDVTFTQVLANGFPVTGAAAPSALFKGPGALPGLTAGSVLQGTVQHGNDRISAMLDAFERVGIARTLAEPTLIAMSGEAAKFHAGGEMPVPTAQQNNTVSVSWKPFGVTVGFTPYVLSEGRISLKVAAEVSELSSQGAVTSGGISVQGLQLRKAETVLEMASGSSLAMAGLLSDQTRRNTDGVLELQNLPVLGPLFRSKDFRNSQSELVILVTPYIVRPTEPGQLSKPNDGKMPVSPMREMLHSHLNRVYSHVPADAVRGGYVIDAPRSLKE